MLYGMTPFEAEFWFFNSQFNPIVEKVGCDRCKVLAGQRCITKNGHTPNHMHTGRRQQYIVHQRERLHNIGW